MTRASSIAALRRKSRQPMPRSGTERRIAVERSANNAERRSARRLKTAVKVATSGGVRRSTRRCGWGPGSNWPASADARIQQKHALQAVTDVECGTHRQTPPARYRPKRALQYRQQEAILRPLPPARPSADRCQCNQKFLVCERFTVLRYAQVTAYFRQQVTGGERLRDVGVGTQREPLGDLDFTPLCSQHNHGNLRCS